MRNKKIIIITIVAGILLIGFVIFLIINSIPKELDDILLDNKYELKSEFEAGSGDDTTTIVRNTTKYKKEETSINVYEYETLDEIKKGILIDYEQYKNNDAFNVLFENKDNYIYMRSCDNSMCHYCLGYDNVLVSTIINIDLKLDTDETFNEIMKKKKIS